MTGASKTGGGQVKDNPGYEGEGHVVKETDAGDADTHKRHHQQQVAPATRTSAPRFIILHYSPFKVCWTYIYLRTRLSDLNLHDLE